MTTEPISDERLAEIRAGLEGVTPGPWGAVPTAEGMGDMRVTAPNPLSRSGRRTVALIAPTKHDEVAHHIARLDPQTVAALLDEVERARALLSRLDKAEAGEPDEARIAAARERAEALGPGMPGIMRTAFADIAENAIRQYFRPLPPPPSSES